ncbi:MAG: Trk system potassium transporter TrkA [Verrucomicrobia bacterium]|nr:Trk system potassium transporter TrkA [Verrucomicrobiota bacterium]
MNIVILGAGKTGSFVASVLSEEQHNVILIDKDPIVLEKVGREIDVATLHCTATCWEAFDDLTEHHPDLFFAATGDDETNLVACSVAKNLGFAKTIARVKSLSYLNHSKFDFGRLFFVDHFIGAEVLAAQDLLKVLVRSGDIAFEHFAHGAIQMRTILIPERWDRGGTPIKDLGLPDNLIVALIHRRGEIIIPHGQDHILPGDEATILGDAKVINQLHEVFHIDERKVHSIVLVGGSPIAQHLAHFLIQQKIKIKIIESNLERCNELADLLPAATIINRDGMDHHLLAQERVQDSDALVACLNDEGANFLIASLAKRLGCSKCIALISDPHLIPLLEKLDVTAALSARANLTNKILSILHEGTILSVASLVRDQVKIVELKVAPSSKVVGIPLSDLSVHLPKDLLIAVIENQGRVMIGRGNSILAPDDIAIVICPPHHIPQLQNLFH